MSRARLVARLIVAGVVAGAGCGVELKQRAKGVRTAIAQARDNGAYRCAPRELAMAESHADFLDDELTYGNYMGARTEFKIAEENARRAIEKSPKEKCNPKVTIVDGRDTDGDGILDRVDKCPKDPEDKDDFEDEDGCPDPDNDGDTVVDHRDRCPLVPGPKDNQGCPDKDRDRDGVTDKNDQCPDEPGLKELAGCPDRDADTIADRDDKCPDVPGPPENQGCPKYQFITVTEDKIELKQKVHFATNKSIIFPDSFSMLNEVADFLIKRPAIEVRIEGHTDSRGNLRKNLKLSQDRANSVRRYLDGRGVQGSRMTSIGYGPTRPVDDNRTAVGREKNRRVEFFITRH